MSGLDDWRDNPRRKIEGRAFWSGQRLEGSCPLTDLSLGGASIAKSKCSLPVGTELLVTLQFDSTTIEAVTARIVRAGRRGALALEFLRLSDEHEALIQEVLLEGTEL